MARTMPGTGQGRDKWNQVLKALTASKEEALKQFHEHTTLSPSSAGGEKTRAASDSAKNQKVKHGSELTLVNSRRMETFFYTPSSQNFGTSGLKQSTGRNEAQGGKWLAVYHKACQWQNLIEHTGPWLLLRNIFGVNCIITIFIPYLS